MCFIYEALLKMYFCFLANSFMHPEQLRYNINTGDEEKKRWEVKSVDFSNILDGYKCESGDASWMKIWRKGKQWRLFIC